MVPQDVPSFDATNSFAARFWMICIIPEIYTIALEGRRSGTVSRQLENIPKHAGLTRILAVAVTHQGMI